MIWSTPRNADKAPRRAIRENQRTQMTKKKKRAQFIVWRCVLLPKPSPLCLASHLNNRGPAVDRKPHIPTPTPQARDPNPCIHPAGVPAALRAVGLCAAAGAAAPVRAFAHQDAAEDAAGSSRGGHAQGRASSPGPRQDPHWLLPSPLVLHEYLPGMPVPHFGTEDVRAAKRT